MSTAESPPAGYEPRRFRTTVPFYARYRLAYPERLIERAATLAGLPAKGRVLDLGCGPGLLALAFARRGAAVIAMDPEPEMLAAAQAEAEAEGLAMQFRPGSSYDLPSDLSGIDLVTMGRSFHWMDRAATLAALDQIVVPGGAVSHFFDTHADTQENDWRDAIADAASAFGLESGRLGGRRRRYGGRCHESFFFESAFREIESAGVFVRRHVGADEIVGRALSLSMCSPEKLGERREAFVAALRAALHKIQPDGQFVEIVELRAVVARRP